MVKLVVAIAALFALTPPAGAAEINVGVQAGYGWSESDVSIPLYPSDFDLDSEGWVAGGFAGVDWDVGSGWALGVEGDANWTDADGDNPSGLVGESYLIQQNWTASFRGRGSFDVAHDTQIYGTAGVAWVDVDTKYQPLAGGTENATLEGWTVGLGVERQYGGWFGRAEYRHSEFDEEGFFHNGPSELDLTTQTLLLGVGLTY